MRRSDRPWIILGVLGVVLTALVTILLMRDDGGSDVASADDSSPAATATSRSPTPIPSPTPTAEPEAADADAGDGADDDDAEGAAAGAGDVDADDGGPGEEGAAAGAGAVEPLPLWGPGDLPSSGGSDVPAVGETLVEGDYFAHVTGAFPETMTLEADIQQLLWGEAAVQYLLVHDPSAEIPPPNGYVIVNESSAVRLVPMADDIRIWDWCFGDHGDLEYLERTLIQWREAPAGSTQECAEGPVDLGHGGALYWLQVRDREVQRVIGQYLP